MTVDECVKLLEELVPSECTDTYTFNGCPFLVKGKVDREAIEDLEAMDPSYVTELLSFFARMLLVHNGHLEGPAPKTTRLK